jgi:hypothetical protein
MRWLRRVISGAKALVRYQRVERELDVELRSFLETAVDERVRSGMSREQATRAARPELGLVSVDSIKDRVRDVGWESTVESVARDVQYAVRTLRNAPGFASVANTAIFGLIDALVLRQLPVRDPDQLVVLTRVQGGQASEHFSYPQVNYLAEQDDLFADLCGLAADTFHIGPSDALETTAGAWVTGEYYRTMGITPIIGRLLGPDDDRPGAPPAAVITDAYWSRKFAHGPDVIGQALLIEGVPVSIAADITFYVEVHFARVDRLAVDGNGHADAASHEWRDRGQTGRLHTRQLLNESQCLLIERSKRRLVLPSPPRIDNRASVLRGARDAVRARV